MHRRAFLAVAGSGLTAGFAGCTALAGQTGTEDYDIGMSPNTFRPESYTVETGDTVVWKNTSSRAHTVTAYGAGQPEGGAYFATGGFDTEPAARTAWNNDRSGSIYTGERFEHAFEVASTHHYFCIPHEQAGMVGKIVVEG